MNPSSFTVITSLCVAIICLAAPCEPPPAPTVAPAAGEAAVASPRDENWIARHQTIVETARQGGFELAFLGDSITQGWNGHGKEIWTNRYTPRNAINLGIGGDRTQHVLWRLDHGLLDALAQTADDTRKANNIKAVVLMIGTNNSGGDAFTAEEIAEGIKAIVTSLRTKLPNAKILLLAIFPRGEAPNPQREKNATASQLAATIADGTLIHYLDIGSKFLNEDGTLSQEIMPDSLHLSSKGYEIWANAIEAKLAELLGEAKH